MTTDAAATADAQHALAALADRAAPPAARTAALRTLTALLRAHTPLRAALLARTATALVAALAAPTAPTASTAPCATALTAALLDPATLSALRGSSSATPVPLIDRAAALLVRLAARTLAQLTQPPSPPALPSTLEALLRALSAALAADRATAARHALAALSLAADVLHTRPPGAAGAAGTEALACVHVQALFYVRHCAAAAPAAAMQAWPRLLGAAHAPILACLAAQPPRRAAVAADTLAALVTAARPFLAVAQATQASSESSKNHAGFTPLSAAVAGALCRAHRAVAHALGVWTAAQGSCRGAHGCVQRLCRALQTLATAAPPARLDAALPAAGLAALLPHLARCPHDAAARDAAAALAAAQPPAAPLARLLATPRAARWLDALAAALEALPENCSSSTTVHQQKEQEQEDEEDDDDESNQGEEEEGDEETEETEEEEEEQGKHVETEAETAAGVRALFAVAQTYGSGAVPAARLAHAAQCVLAAATAPGRARPALVCTVCAAAARLPPALLCAVWRACAPALLAAPAPAATADAVLGLCARLDAACLRARPDTAMTLVAAVLGAPPAAQRTALAAAARFLGASDYWAAHVPAVARLVAAALTAVQEGACRTAALGCLATAARYAPLLDAAQANALCTTLCGAVGADGADDEDAATALRGIAAVCAAPDARRDAETTRALEACVLAGLRARAPKTQWNACIAARAVLAAASTAGADDASAAATHAALAHTLVFSIVARTDSCKLRVHACAALQALRTRAALGPDHARALSVLAAAVHRAAADAYSPATRRYRPALLASVCHTHSTHTVSVTICTAFT